MKQYFVRNFVAQIFLFDEKVGKVSLILCGGPDSSKMDGHTSKVFQVKERTCE